MTNLLIERRDEVDALLSTAETCFQQLRRRFKSAQGEEDVIDIRAAIADTVFPLNLAHYALAE
jgi:hypothetical protein